VTRLLVDTHALLWFLFDDPRMHESAAQRLSDPSVQKLLSVASLWEIAIKSQVGKLELGMSFDEFVRAHVLGATVDLVGLEVPHLFAYSALPLHHRDPFDRVLVAQAQVLGVPILSADPQLAAYGVPLVWSEPT
jgi:PIN domain nuclease of toxin-antitoxin system